MTMLNTTHATTRTAPTAATIRRRRRADRPAVHVAAPLATRSGRRALRDAAPDPYAAIESDGLFLRLLDGPAALFDRCA
jgi:hypothetical protein